MVTRAQGVPQSGDPATLVTHSIYHNTGGGQTEGADMGAGVGMVTLCAHSHPSR